MTDLNDKMKRKELIRRYLNAETTVEEEQLLLNFLEHNVEGLTPEEEDLRLIIISTIHLAGDVGLSDEKEAEFDKMMEAESAGGKANKISSKILWPSSMVAALILALFLLPWEAKEDTPAAQQYAKKTTMTPSPTSQQTSFEDKRQSKEKEAVFQMAMEEDGADKETSILAYAKEKPEEDMSISGENKPEPTAVEASEAEMPSATASATTTTNTIQNEPYDRGYPLNVTAANYNGGHQGSHRFQPSGDITITTKARPNGNASPYTVVNTRKGMRMLYSEMQDDSAIYIIDGKRVAKETVNRISPDEIKEMRRLQRGTSDAIKETPEGLTHDIILITTKRTAIDEQDHSMIPRRNGLLISDDDKSNGICLL